MDKTDIYRYAVIGILHMIESHQEDLDATKALLAAGHKEDVTVHKPATKKNQPKAKSKASVAVKKKPIVAAKPAPRRLSAEARKRISLAQRRRWREYHENHQKEMKANAAA